MGTPCDVPEPRMVTFNDMGAKVVRNEKEEMRRKK
jgi:hypothetical protein